MKFRLGTKVDGGGRQSKAGVSLITWNRPRVARRKPSIAMLCWWRSAGGPLTAGLRTRRYRCRCTRQSRLHPNRRTGSRPVYPASTPSAMSFPVPMLAHKAEDEGVGRGRDDGQPVGSYRLQRHPRGGLSPRPRRRRSAGPKSSSRKKRVEYRVGKFPFIANSRARAAGGDSIGFRQDPDRCRDRRDIGRPHHRTRRGYPDRRAGACHRIRRVGGRCRAHLSRPPDAKRSGKGSGAGCLEQAHPRLGTS